MSSAECGELAAHTVSSVRTTAEACDRVETLTGIRRKPTQVRAFLAALGFRWRWVFVRAASGRQRFNVLGAWDAVTRTLTTVTNTRW